MMAITVKISKVVNPPYYLLIAIALLSACSQRSRWACDQIHSDIKESRSTKLCYLADDPIHGIDLEFIRIGDRVNTYLNVHSLPVPSIANNRKSALLKIEIDGKVLRCEAYRLEGGQRFLLSKETAEILIETLQNQREVKFILPGYQSTIKAEDFSAKFNQFNDPFPLQNPFYLPL